MLFKTNNLLFIWWHEAIDVVVNSILTTKMFPLHIWHCPVNPILQRILWDAPGGCNRVWNTPMVRFIFIETFECLFRNFSFIFSSVVNSLFRLPMQRFLSTLSSRWVHSFVAGLVCDLLRLLEAGGETTFTNRLQRTDNSCDVFLNSEVGLE